MKGGVNESMGKYNEGCYDMLVRVLQYPSEGFYDMLMKGVTIC